jgi:hypothetical protein
MISLFKSSYQKLFSKNNLEKKSYKFKSVTSTFENVSQYDLDGLNTARIHTKDIIPYKYKNQINYKKEDLYTVVETNEFLSKSIIINSNNISESNNEEIISRIKSILEVKIIHAIDEMIYFLMSELGRKTSTIYGQLKESIGTFTISNETTSESILQKLEYSDIVLKELNSIGLKHIIISKSMYLKLINYVKESKIKINHKLISFQILPDYLETPDQLCLIATSQTVKDLTPGIAIVYKNLILDIIKKPKEEIVEFHLSKEYCLQKIGKTEQQHESSRNQGA